MDSSKHVPGQNDETLLALTNYCAALYHVDPFNRVMLFGTGFFVRDGRSHFLVTAAHVLDHYNQGLYYFPFANTRRKIVGRGGTSTPRAPTRNKDLLDVGTIWLPDDDAPPYPAIIDVSQLTPQVLPRAEQRYAIAGFPLTKASFSHAEKTNFVVPYVFADCTPVSDEAYAKYGFNPKQHVLLQQDLRKGFGGDGNRRAFPKPQGMSGGPVFAFDEKERIIRLVAVATAYRKSEKLFIATDVTHVLEGIRQLKAARLRR